MSRKGGLYYKGDGYFLTYKNYFVLLLFMYTNKIADNHYHTFVGISIWHFSTVMLGDGVSKEGEDPKKGGG